MFRDAGFWQALPNHEANRVAVAPARWEAEGRRAEAQGAAAARLAQGAAPLREGRRGARHLARREGGLEPAESALLRGHRTQLRERAGAVRTADHRVLPVGEPPPPRGRG